MSKNLIYRILANSVVVSAAILSGYISFNLGVYYVAKKHLINQTIRNGKIEVLTLIEEENTTTDRRSLLTRLLKNIDNFGSRLAEKRFKEGKFDRTIEKDRSQQQTNYTG